MVLGTTKIAILKIFCVSHLYFVQLLIYLLQILIYVCLSGPGPIQVPIAPAAVIPTRGQCQFPATGNVPTVFLLLKSAEHPDSLPYILNKLILNWDLIFFPLFLTLGLVSLGYI